MPFNEVMPKFKRGLLRSGGAGGPVVRNRKQAIAIMLSEKKKADAGDQEYQASGSGKDRLRQSLRGGTGR
jgi:Family of unknown function (DUF6496)